jgi:hypothetical protein
MTAEPTGNSRNWNKLRYVHEIKARLTPYFFHMILPQGSGRFQRNSDLFSREVNGKSEAERWMHSIQQTKFA